MSYAKKLQPTYKYARRTISGVRKKVIPSKLDKDEADSCPTSVFSLGYKDIHSRFLLLATRFESRALELSHNLEILDISASKECKQAAKNVRGLAERTLHLPSKSDAALTVEKSYLCEQFSSYIMYAQKLIGDRIL